MGDKTSKEDMKKAAKAFSQLGASKGGKARAKALSHNERKEIARKAALTRWGKPTEPVFLENTDEMEISSNVEANGEMPYSMSG